jgi:LmbE family N-acetylglucosaminyl deacetylase
MPYHGEKVKRIFEELKQAVSPDLIFTHRRDDAHQDHRLLCELTWNTFRNHFILEYEIPKYDGDMGAPSVFVPLEQSICDRKVDQLINTFHSQASKHWFDRSMFHAAARNGVQFSQRLRRGFLLPQAGALSSEQNQGFPIGNSAHSVPNHCW